MEQIFEFVMVEHVLMGLVVTVVVVVVVVLTMTEMMKTMKTMRILIKTLMRTVQVRVIFVQVMSTQITVKAMAKATVMYHTSQISYLSLNYEVVNELPRYFRLY